MNREIRDRWLTALRSGDIPQVRGRLGTPAGGRCCLGVLCDLAVEDEIIPAPKVFLDDYLQYGFESSISANNHLILPDEVVEWAGLNTNAGLEDADGNGNHLAGVNDGGAPFSRIADIIEEKL